MTQSVVCMKRRMKLIFINFLLLAKIRIQAYHWRSLKSSQMPPFRVAIKKVLSI